MTMAAVLVMAEMFWITRTMSSNDCLQEESVVEKGANPLALARQRALVDSEQFLLESSQSSVLVDRVYRKWDYEQDPFPCVPCERMWRNVMVIRSPADTGIMYIRNMKTGSSTLGGIAIRIARAMKRKTQPDMEAEMCRVRFDHTRAVDFQFGQRKFNQSFLYSFIRDPNKRALSEFYHFGVSRFKLEPSDANFQEYFRSRYFLNNYFLWHMSLKGYNPKSSDKNATVVEIMKGYDFIGLTERMDESLVVLKMLLGLDLNDVLYLAASKGNGGFDDGAYNGKCHYIIPKYVSPGMKEWMASEEWQSRVDGDTMLYKAANRSLERTIEALGREEVYYQVYQFQQLKKQAVDECMAKTTFPCAADGSRHARNHSCLWWDLGCGYQCLDDLNGDDSTEEVANARLRRYF